MTKTVRIENADNSDHKIVVQTWQKVVDGGPDTMVNEQALNNPTDMCSEMVWDNQYLIIREIE